MAKARVAKRGWSERGFVEVVSVGLWVCGGWPKCGGGWLWFCGGRVVGVVSVGLWEDGQSMVVVGCGFVEEGLWVWGCGLMGLVQTKREEESLERREEERERNEYIYIYIYREREREMNKNK